MRKIFNSNNTFIKIINIILITICTLSLGYAVGSTYYINSDSFNIYSYGNRPGRIGNKLCVVAGSGLPGTSDVLKAQSSVCDLENEKLQETMRFESSLFEESMEFHIHVSYGIAASSLLVLFIVNVFLKDNKQTTKK